MPREFRPQPKSGSNRKGERHGLFRKNPNKAPWVYKICAVGLFPEVNYVATFIAGWTY